MDIKNIPILFLIFNRPDLAEQVFSVIREAQPRQLFIAADGPREDKPGEAALCAKTRKVVMEMIDWDCEVNTLFREKNIGCKIAVSAAITWFFEHVEEGIILEDDCLPDISFFNFCGELLEEYRNSENIMHISGNNFQMSCIGEASYYLSKIPHIWGWATWRRAWKKYDIKLSSFDEKISGSYFNDPEIDLFWQNIFAMMKRGEIDTWDYQWTYTLFYHNGLAIQPQYNLVKNIGFDQRGSRTKYERDYSANLKTHPINSITHLTTLAYSNEPDIQFQKIFGWIQPIYTNRLSFKMLLNLFFEKLKRLLLMGK